MSKRTQQMKSSASDTSIGFDYQFYYYFFLVLGLKHGDNIGIEIKDDVHIDLSDGTVILIQTKHSLQKRSDGEIINLTERDGDLWKTLSNWIKIINEQTSKDDYVSKTFFQLVTNKSNSKNPFITSILQVQSSTLKIIDFKIYLRQLIDITEDKIIKAQITLMYKMSNGLLNVFLKKIKFDLNEDDLINRIKQRIIEKNYPAERIEDIYNSLQSNLRDKNYLTIKLGVKTQLNFEDFNKHFKNCFSIGINSKLPIRNLKLIIPSDPREQLFIKQLIEIGDITEDDREQIIEYTTQMLKLYNNLDEWEKKDGLLPSSRKAFDKNSILIWKNSFRSKYRKVLDAIENGTLVENIEISLIRESALSCLDEMKRQILTIDETVLDIELSNGHFYLLTEEKNIGWHYDWVQKYK